MITNVKYEKRKFILLKKLNIIFKIVGKHSQNSIKLNETLVWKPSKQLSEAERIY